MDFDGTTAIVTGAGQGIGAAVARLLSAKDARVLVSDLSAEHADCVAREIGGIAHHGDLSDLSVVEDMVSAAERAFGHVDILVSSAGFALGEPDGPTSQTDAHWQKSWDLHVMAHLRAARLLLPSMIARRSGTLVNIASAAGLVSQIGDAAYSATKHAAVSLAQSLAIEHGVDGIQVSVVCPLYVATPLLGYTDADKELPTGVITPEDVAQATLGGIAQGQFLILPHPEAQTYFVQRASDTDRWITGMQRLRDRVMAQAEGTDPAALHKLI